MGRILKKVGWSRQLPQRKARQQDAKAVAQWREECLPELKKSEGWRESNFVCRWVSLLSITFIGAHLGPLWAHTGTDPLKSDGDYHPNGRIYVAGQDQAFTGKDIVWF